MSEFRSNDNWELRDSKLQPRWWSEDPTVEGKVVWSTEPKLFEMDSDTLAWMLENGYVNPEQWHNESQNKMIIDFIKLHPEFKALGFAIHPERHDSRIGLILEGMLYYGDSDISTLSKYRFNRLEDKADEWINYSPSGTFDYYYRAWWD
jgi:hypothetical protein